MNGPTKMYKTKQIIKHDFEVTLPSCMYKIKNIHQHQEKKGDIRNGVLLLSSSESSNISEQNNFNNTSDMSALEQKQELILKQLADLKNQMVSLKCNLNIGNEDRIVIKTTDPIQIPDIVINASPANPPYSLVLVQKLWKDRVHLAVTVHTHSTIQSLPDNLTAFTKTLIDFKPSTSNVPTVNVRLIWKDVGVSTQTILSQSSVLGEVNLLRYLARAAPSMMAYEGCDDVMKIDALLDVCYRIVCAGTKTERGRLLQTINKNLGKSPWLLGRNEISVADLAAYSAIKQAIATNDINVNLKKWMQRCEA